MMSDGAEPVFKAASPEEVARRPKPPDPYLGVKTSEEWDAIHAEWKRKHPILAWLKTNVYYPSCRFWRWFSDVPFQIKYFIQRGIRGWSNQDAWGAYYHISSVTLGMLKWLKINKHGVPCGCINDAEPFEVGQKRWDDIMDKMIYSFQCLVDAENGKSEFWTPHPDAPEVHLLEYGDNPWSQKYPEVHLMNKEEDDKYNEGMQLFIKYYQSLWD